MAWSAVGTAVTGAVAAASFWNTFVRDNSLETVPAKAEAAGDLFYATGPNAITRLPISTDDAILRVTSGVLEWGLPITTPKIVNLALLNVYDSGSITSLQPQRTDIGTVEVQVPESGSIRFITTAVSHRTDIGASTARMGLLYLLSSDTDTSEPPLVVASQVSGDARFFLHSQDISGLTPGDSLAYKASVTIHRISGTSGIRLRIGEASSSQFRFGRPMVTVYAL